MKQYTAEDFYRYIAARSLIWYKKEVLKEPPPWTTDPILATYHFCNTYRALDYGTRWYQDNVVPYAANGPDLMWRTIVYRLVNNTTYFERFGWRAPIFGLVDWQVERAEIVALIITAGKPYSPAYIVLQRNRPTSRSQNFLDTLDELSPQVEELLVELKSASGQRAGIKILTRIKGIGNFVAFQVIRDLILAGALRYSEDDWCYIGPGAKAGLKLLMGKEASAAKQQAFLKELWAGQKEPLKALGMKWWNEQPLSLCDIEHNLCEMNKALKFREGRGKHRIYKPHLSGV